MLTFRILLILLLGALSPLTHAAPRTLLVLGDSLSAGYGLRSEQAWPALLAQRLAERKADYNVVNLSISGETTAGGRTRLPAALARHRPALVILALGANDGLRGLPVRQMQDNLHAMITASRQAGARVLLIGMRLPPNYGPYAQAFHSAFADLARTERVAWLPFLLEPIADSTGLFLPDNLHPTAEAQPRLLDHVWRALQPLL